MSKFLNIPSDHYRIICLHALHFATQVCVVSKNLICNCESVEPTLSYLSLSLVAISSNLARSGSVSQRLPSSLATSATFMPGLDARSLGLSSAQ